MVHDHGHIRRADPSPPRRWRARTRARILTARSSQLFVGRPQSSSSSRVVRRSWPRTWPTQPRMSPMQHWTSYRQLLRPRLPGRLRLRRRNVPALPPAGRRGGDRGGRTERAARLRAHPAGVRCAARPRPASPSPRARWSSPRRMAATRPASRCARPRHLRRGTPFGPGGDGDGDGRAGDLTWDASDGRVQLGLRRGWHGAPYTAQVVCEVDDGGELTVPESLVDAYIDQTGDGAVD